MEAKKHKVEQMKRHIREKKKNSKWPSQPSWTNEFTKRKMKIIVSSHLSDVIVTVAFIVA